jgi:acyl-coenzyme A thioesterase PaaI-like protein
MTRLHDLGPADAAPSVPTGTEELRTAAPEIFVGDIPFGFDVGDDGVHMAGDATITDALRSPGSGLPRPSVLATIADCMAGIPACMVTAPQLAVTLDIAVRITAAHCGDRLVLDGEIVKQGRSTVAAEVRFSDARTNALVATSYVTFMGSPRPQDQAPLLLRGMRTTGSMAIPLPDYVGIRTPSPGIAEMDLTPFVMQASSSLQGGAVALLGEVASETLTLSTVLDLDVRYLSAVRVGPGRATASALGADHVRIEVRDQGSADRLAALIVTRVAPAP